MRWLARNLVVLLVVCAPLACLRCTSTSTSLTAPTTDKCEIGLTSGPSSFGSGGGDGSVVVSAERNCSWTASTEVPWVSIVGNRTGQGQGRVNFTVAPNPIPAARTGVISVASARVEISQKPAPCTAELSETAGEVGAGGGRVSVEIHTPTGCTWKAVSEARWITVESGASGNGSAVVQFVADANPGGARVGQVVIGGRRYMLSQAALLPPTSPTPAPVPSPPPPTPVPQPPPPPPAPPATPADLEGKVGHLSGKCPTISFTVAGQSVATTSKTSYRNGACHDISKNDRVHVRGIRQSNGSVEATLIELERDDDDD